MIIEGNTIVINMEGEVKLNTDRNQTAKRMMKLESALEHFVKVTTTWSLSTFIR